MIKKLIGWIIGGYEYGTCTIHGYSGHSNTERNARRHRRHRNVQFIVWKAGEQGHKEDFWHDMDSSHWPYFTVKPKHTDDMENPLWTPGDTPPKSSYQNCVFCDGSWSKYVVGHYGDTTFGPVYKVTRAVLYKSGHVGWSDLKPIKWSYVPDFNIPKAKIRANEIIDELAQFPLEEIVHKFQYPHIWQRLVDKVRKYQKQQE